MNPLETFDLACPWCGEPIEILVDLSVGSQSYIEDCQICCAPILVRVQVGLDVDQPPEVTLSREDGGGT